MNRVVVNSSSLIVLCRFLHRCKKSFFTFYNVFLFSKRFFIFKNVGKVQSGKQINKKHFQNNSNDTDL